MRATIEIDDELLVEARKVLGTDRYSCASP